MPRIAAVVCTYNRYDLLPKAIQSLAQQSVGAADYKIVIVDNSPDHEAAARYAEQLRGPSNLTYLVENTPGLSNARNVAARECGTEIIAYMDDDAIADPRWLEELLRAYERFGPEVGIVGGRVVPIWEAERPRWLHDRLLGHVSVVDWGGEYRVAAPNEWFAGTNVSYRTDLVLRHGGFNPSLGRVGSGISLMSNEEIELSEAIKAAGKLLVYAPEARVDHLVDRKRLSRTWFRKRAAWQAVSDFVMKPEQTLEAAQRQWRPLLDYFNSLPPKERSIRGLYVETEDPEAFLWQLGAIYMAEVAALSGFEHAER
jgi:glycosyltransferase involved in cell wall biosynthesis